MSAIDTTLDTVRNELQHLAQEREVHMLLVGVTGSRAYGLARPDSDYDFIGVFAYPTLTVLSTIGQLNDTLRLSSADGTLHEIEKFLRLALSGNPTLLELLWLEEHVESTEQGGWLLDLRTALLGKHLVNPFVGYARSQIIKAAKQGPTWQRYSKSVIAAFRILAELESIAVSGQLQVRVADPAALQACAEMDVDSMVRAFDERLQQVKAEVDASALPPGPDRNAARDTLLRIRLDLL